MRIGSKIYYCSRIDKDNSQIDTFMPPKEEFTRLPNIMCPISLVVQDKNGYTDRLEYGETVADYKRITLTPYEYWVGKFKIGDRFYLDGAKPSNDELSYGENANYFVEDISNPNLSIILSLKKIN